MAYSARSAAQAAEYDAHNVVAQKIQLAESVRQLENRVDTTPIVVKKAVTADARSGLSITIPYAFELVDVTVQCTTSTGSATMQIKNGTDAVTNAIICAVDKVITRAGSIDTAFNSFTTSSVIKVFSNGAADRGIVYLTGYRT